MTAQGLTGDRVVEGHYRALPTEIEESLLTLVLNLATEVWTLRDRTRLLQEILAEQGVVPASTFDEWRDKPAQLASMSEDRDAFVARLFRSVTAVSGDGRPLQSVADDE